MYDGLLGQWQGPVVWWQPVLGERHALTPEERPRPGQVRDTLCGLSVELGSPSGADWLHPTCDECWSKAIVRNEERSERMREQERAWGFGEQGMKWGRLG